MFFSVLENTFSLISYVLLCPFKLFVLIKILFLAYYFKTEVKYDSLPSPYDSHGLFLPAENVFPTWCLPSEGEYIIKSSNLTEPTIFTWRTEHRGTRARECMNTHLFFQMAPRVSEQIPASAGFRAPWNKHYQLLLG